MSDDTMPEAAEVSVPLDAPDASQPNGTPTESTSTDGTPTEGTPAPQGQAPRRRRRGSRGGRNRKKKPAAVVGNGSSPEPGLAPPLADELVGHDYTDAMADRGLTTEDVAEVAREEAGLVP